MLPDKRMTNAEIEDVYQPEVQIGEWYWVKKDEDDEDALEESFACVTNIGSNYFKLQAPIRDRWSRSWRIHFNDFDERCRKEKDPIGYIQSKVSETQQNLRIKMQEINETTRRLGLQCVNQLEVSSENLLPAVVREGDIDNYKNELIKTKDKLLPELFAEMEEFNNDLAYWLGAEAVPMQALAKQAEKSLDFVEDRIFNVELYSGLIEKVKLIKKGKIAPIDEKLHIMQRLCYMDEECLLDYQAGGINFEKITDFEKWLKKKNNFSRIFPFPRCIVAFRVRRKHKPYKEIDNIFVRISMQNADYETFLYIRNGDRLWRLSTGIEFGEKLFPDTSEFHTGEFVWAKMFADKVDEIIPDRLYQDNLNKAKETRRKIKEWQKANRGKHWMHNPHRNGYDFNEDCWEPFDYSSIYFDDIKEKIASDAKQYNRIALIVQGLFDRSEILHPHVPVNVWDEESFQSAIKLVYDAQMILTDGDAPLFEEYRKELNKTLDVGCIAIGQEMVWERREAKRENKRTANSWREKTTYYTAIRPYGDPGPGTVAKVVRKSGKKFRFEWKREKRFGRWDDDKINDAISVHIDELFNVSAYDPGDYHIFFDDPRTRLQYIEWAPYLLAAEDYYAGKLKLNAE